MFPVGSNLISTNVKFVIDIRNIIRRIIRNITIVAVILHKCLIFVIKKATNLKRVLFIAHHRLDRSPGQRYRFEQYFDWFESNGIQCELSNLLDEEDDKVLYSPGKYWEKLKIAIKSYKKRKSDFARVKDFDAVLIYREALLTRGIKFERKIAKAGVPIIFDYDDAIWVKDVSSGNKWLSFLKSSDKIKSILPLCTHVTVGNQYLGEFARKYNQSVTVIPSTIDCTKYVPQERTNDKVVIGWVGSHTTVKHFELVVNVYHKLKEKYGNAIDFKVIGDPNYSNERLGIKGEPWDNNQEVEHFNSIDIGVMPLEEDAWTKGKCGMKGLLYMSVGKPAVMSAVGMNTNIVTHNDNGYVPVGEEQWFDVLSELIDNPSLRKSIGEKGRETVLERYSFESQKYALLNVYNGVLNLPEVKKSTSIKEENLPELVQV